jgi:hypothetical protein
MLPQGGKGDFMFKKYLGLALAAVLMLASSEADAYTLTIVNTSGTFFDNTVHVGCYVNGVIVRSVNIPSVGPHPCEGMYNVGLVKDSTDPMGNQVTTSMGGNIIAVGSKSNITVTINANNYLSASSS